MKGIITKLLKDLYFVETEKGVIESKARGVFRKKNISPVVGDWVDIQINDDGSGYIEEVLPRKNKLLRPDVANIDKIIHIHSIKDPKISTYMLDKALVMSEFYNIEPIIIFSKTDLVSPDKLEKYKEIYQKALYSVYRSSSYQDDDFDLIIEELKGSTCAVSGPSGSGKSTFINRLNENFNLEISNVSEKTKRGRHTTRHIELHKIFEDSHILDTPGFSTINLYFIDDERDLGSYFPEIRAVRSQCKFNNCLHINEPGCQVKNSLGSSISQTRYDNYILFIEEIKEMRRY